jgi:Mor family transcriptional regulator
VCKLKYNNAKNKLPEWLLDEIQVYIQGEVIYIPKKEDTRIKWGEANGTRKHYMRRNMEIVKKHRKGAGVTDLSVQYCLSEHSIKKILTDMKEVI